MGSRNKNTGENRSKRMANELNVAGSQVARGTSLHGTNEAFDKALRDEVKKGRKVAGTNIRHGFNALKNIDPNRLSDFRGGTKYSGDTAGTVNAQELREIGLERDKLANQRTYAGDQLGALESGNRFLGLNPTSGMGIMQSLKRNFTNPEAQRSYANTRNIGRTLANMGPIGGILRGLSNSLFGTDLQPMQMEGMPMGNIDPRVAGFFGAAQGAPNTAFGYTESPLNMETYSPDYIADRLFNTYTAPAADPIRQPVFTGEQTTMTPMRRPDQPTYSSPAFDIHPPSHLTDNNRVMPYDMLLAGPLYGAGPFGPDDFVKQGFAENFNDVGQMDRFAQFHNNAPEFQKFIDPIHHPPAGGPLVANDTRIDQFIAGAPNVGVYPNNLGMSQEAMDTWNMTPEIAADNQANAMGVYGYGN